MLVLLACLFAVAAAARAGEAPVTPSPPVAPPATSDANAPEVKPDNLALQPALISVAANQGGTMSFNELEPSTLLGGVRLGYEEALVLCDHVHYWQSKILGLKRPTLDHALIASGPDAEEPGHVVFDTRASKLPQIPFRGLIRPREVEIIRQPLDPKDKAHVRFRVLLHKLGEFAGDLHTANGWVPVHGRAEEAELTVIGEVVPGGIANPHIARIELRCRPAAAGVEKLPAGLGRKPIPLTGELDKVEKPDATGAGKAQGKKDLDLDAYAWWYESSLITIDFDEQGRLVKSNFGPDARGYGTPNLDTPVQVPAPVNPGAQPPKPKAP